ncbi:MAG TPA: hypothetical protein VGM88_06340 [Kofleriaceae bacterium]|jgi:hypothetical protein
MRPIAFVLALAACTANQAGGSHTGSGDDDGDDGGGDDGGDTTPTPLTIDGAYTLRSSYDLATNIPGTVGDVINTIIAATDDPDDPTHWLLDELIDAMPGGTFKTLLENAEPFVTGYLNDRLLEWAPSFVTTMVNVGNNFGELAKHVGLNETLVITSADGQTLATRTITGVHFDVNNHPTDIAFADAGISVAPVAGIAVTVDQTGKLTLAQNQIALPYGAILRLGLDAVVIPSIDPNATDLVSLMEDQVHCDLVGDAIADAIGFGGASTFESACHDALSAAADFIYSKIDDISGVGLTIDASGVAKIIDTTGDHEADTIATGTWDGTASYGGSDPAPLATATFFGSKQTF